MFRAVDELPNDGKVIDDLRGRMMSEKDRSK
jgi:hypothetical protein